MAYSLLSRAFGPLKANLPCLVTEAGSGIPAIILGSSTGGVVSDLGHCLLDGSGNLNVYVDDSKTWVTTVDSGATPGPVDVLSSTQIASVASSASFDWAALPSAMNKVDWGVRTSATGFNVFRMIPPSEWVNIQAGISVMDHSAAIQSALTNNLSVYLPEGHYNGSNLTLRYGQLVTGGSRFTTWIMSSANAPVFTLGGSEVGGLNIGFVHIQDIRIMGSLAAGASQHAIRVVPQQSFCTVARVHIVTMGGNGIDFRGTVTASGNDQWHVVDTKIEQCVGYAVSADAQLATSIFENVEAYGNRTGGWLLQSTGGYRLDNNLFIRCHTRTNVSPTNLVCNGWDIGVGVQNSTWINCWCEGNGNTITPDTNRVSAGWKISTGANSHLTFIGAKNSVQSRGFWITGNTTGVEIRGPSFLLMSQFRSSADILVDAGSSVEIINPYNQNNPLIISIVDNLSSVKYQGIAIPSATTRIARGSEYKFNDGTLTRFLAGGATANTYGATVSGTAGTPFVTATAGHSLRIGDHVQITGAGTSGALLHAYIISMNATDLVITLDRNLVTTVSGVTCNNGNNLPSQGTFTCVVSGGTTAGAGSGYSGQVGTYTIDEYGYATVNYAATWTGHTGTGATLIPVPLTCAESNFNAVSLSSYTFGAGNYPIACIFIGAVNIQPAFYADGGANTALPLDTAATIRGNIRFKVAVPV